MDTPAPDGLLLVEQFFRSLGEQGIAYCLLRNADEVERGDAHDVDMTVERSRLREAEQLLFRAAEATGWLPQMRTGSAADGVYIKCYHFYRRTAAGELLLAHFDIFPTYAWNGRVLLDNAQLLEGAETRGLYRKAHPAVEAVTKLFIRLLFNGAVKEKYKPSVRAVFAAEREAVLSCMGHFLSPAAASAVYEDVAAERWQTIEQRRAALVREIHAHARGQRLAYGCYLLRKLLHRAAPIIAFEGTDGSGKTTIIQALPQLLSHTFDEGLTHCYHWRPGFLVPEAKRNADGSAADASRPHELPPRGFCASLLRLGVFAADYILGYWCRAYRQAAKGHLVIFDRYYEDFFLDKKRYRLTMPDGLLSLVYAFIPKADITFLLMGDAETIYRRKKEIPAAEVQEQLNRLSALRTRVKNPVVIDVNQPIPAVVQSVGMALMQYLNQRHHS